MPGNRKVIKLVRLNQPSYKRVENIEAQPKLELLIYLIDMRTKLNK